MKALAGDVYYVAIDFPQDRNTNLMTVVFPDNPMNTSHLLQVVNVKIGARVMLTNNIDVAEGLTNGAMGIVSAVATKSKSTFHVILERFDSDQIGSLTQSNSKYKHDDINVVPIGKMDMSFGFMENTYVRVSRTQFPFYLCWVVTIHKYHGMTLPQIVVDMSPNKGTFKNSQAYVAFSRVNSLENLYIVNYNCDQIRVSRTMEHEMTRIDRSSISSLCQPMIVRVNRFSFLHLAHLNVCGLKPKESDIRCDKTLKHVDVICFNEIVM